jgi:hypothetical protein
MAEHAGNDVGPVVRARRAAARAKRSAIRLGRSARSAMLDPLRRGDRTVIMCPPAGLRLGNFLYLWLRAHRRTRGGSPTVVRRSQAMMPWLELLPEVMALTVSDDAIRFRDRREWDNTFLYQRFGVDFTGQDVRAFVDDVLAPHIPPDLSRTVVVNIRRGDYYTEFREKYGFDQVGYVREALTRFSDMHRVLVVSDDVEWCRANIGPVVDAAAPMVEYAEPDAWGNFSTVAGASRIIGTNSTFSYWAAYVADTIHPNAQIVMPRFHARAPDAIDAYQLDPRWTALDGFHGR